MKRERGFSLLELTLALALVSIALLLAADLLAESRGLLVTGARHLTTPLPGLLAGRLRAEAQGARGVRGASPDLLPLWSPEPLELVSGDGEETITFAALDGRLWQRVHDRDGALTGEAMLVEQLGSFRWRLLNRRLVEIEIVYRQPPEITAAPLTDRPSRLADRLGLETFTLALRGGGRRSGW